MTGGQRPPVPPSELAVLAGAFSIGFQFLHLADPDGVPARLLGTGLGLLLRPLLETGPDASAPPTEGGLG